jgi:hypothetical protein
VTAAAEALWRIVQWRSRPDIGASSLLRRPLKGAALFHKLWPFHFTGYDDHGRITVDKMTVEEYMSTAFSLGGTFCLS